MSQWGSLVAIALEGLRATYESPRHPLPHTRGWNGSHTHCEGDNPRYALITLLGLARAEPLGGADCELMQVLWGRIRDAAARWSPTPGDRGLGLWARSLSQTDERLFTATNALDALRSSAQRCDSVELAWLLLGADHALLAEQEACDAARLAEEARARLFELFNAQSGLFFRHFRKGPAHAVSRRVPCFANQIYPLMALSVHAQRTGCRHSREIARVVADRLCRLQGPLGQWWWLYDAGDGSVVDGYPVYSVHQDGMAPMALLEAEKVTGVSYDDEIQRGLRWIHGQNEISQSLVLTEQGLILRDIHQHGVGRVSRAFRAALWRRGWRRRGKKTRRFVVNAECRPYHLGWMLYAAALAHERAAGDRHATQALAPVAK